MCSFKSSLLFCFVTLGAFAQLDCSNGICDETSMLQIKGDVKTGASQLSASQSQCLEDYATGLDGIHPGMGGGIRSHPGKVEKTSNRPIVLGVGSGATGTSSLSTALIQIFQDFGSKLKVSHSQHSPEENCDWLLNLYKTLHLEPKECFAQLRKFDFTTIADSVGALLDGPTYELFTDFFLSFPKATYILTSRNSSELAQARAKHVLSLPLPIQEPCGAEMPPGQSPPLSMFARMFSLNDDLVRCMVPPERLMEIDVFSKPSDGKMQEIGEFLRKHEFTEKSKEEVTELLGKKVYPHVSVLDIPAPVCKAFLEHGYPAPKSIAPVYREEAVKEVSAPRFVVDIRDI